MAPVVRRSDSAIHRIVRIFSTFVKCLKNCETTDTDEPNAIKTKKQQKNFILMRIVLNPSLLSYFNSFLDNGSDPCMVYRLGWVFLTVRSGRQKLIAS